MTGQASDIHRTIRNLESVFSRGNASGIEDFYSNDSLLGPPGINFIQGKRNIAAYWQEAMNMGIAHLKIEIIELEQHGDTAIEISGYVLSDADYQVVDQGKGIVIWKNEEGGWKIHREIWNSNFVEDDSERGQ